VSLTRASVLVVEDDHQLRLLLERLFLAEGFDVRGASEGAEALRLVQEQRPDVIVLDLILPWVNGIEVLAAVRQQPHLISIPVLVTTGTPNQRIRSAQLWAPACHAETARP
jgi:CheY-like chemotaxis protein